MRLTQWSYTDTTTLIPLPDEGAMGVIRFTPNKGTCASHISFDGSRFVLKGSVRKAMFSSADQYIVIVLASNNDIRNFHGVGIVTNGRKCQFATLTDSHVSPCDSIFTQSNLYTPMISGVIGFDFEVTCATTVRDQTLYLDGSWKCSGMTSQTDNNFVTFSGIEKWHYGDSAHHGLGVFSKHKNPWAVDLAWLHSERHPSTNGISVSSL